MKDKTKDRIWTFLTIVIVLVVVAGGIRHSAPLLRRLFKLREQEAECVRKIHDLELEKAEIENRTRRFEVDEEFVKAVARENKLYHPKEYVIIFGDRGE